ncbi:MAG: ABC transporter substrate-binding protein [Eggerthellaceae bacterium]|nr:ABC transporter substrate-binding protein [Eggerthellaceae bacterium]
MGRKRFAATLIACALAALCCLWGCAQTSSSAASSDGASADSASSSESAAADAGELAKVSFVLDYAPNVNHTGLYVAQEKGWFAEEGVEVEFVPAPADGSDALIGSGGANMGMTYQDYIANSLGSATPMPYTAVAAVVQHNTSGILSREKDGITKPAQMAGHRYATWNLPVELATIKKLVEDGGASFDDVELVPYEVDDDVMGLQADLYDCVWVYEWWAVANAKLQGYPVNYFAFGDMDTIFDFYTPVIAVNDDFAKANPDTVRAFLRAAKRGYEFAAENPQESGEILCAAVPELDPALIQEAQSILSPQYIADAPSWGVIDEARWSAFYQWINDEGLSENPFDAASGFTMEYLE